MKRRSLATEETRDPNVASLIVQLKPAPCRALHVASNNAAHGNNARRASINNRPRRHA
jgi:hypothetical protein